MQLSPRLLKIASLVPRGSSLADVGTDHGYIPVHCLRGGIIKKAIAMDINPQPLKRAEANFIKYGCLDCAELRLSDGLEKLKAGEADVIVIAGMGGLLIADILARGAHAIGDDTLLLLQPMNAPSELRACLFKSGFDIADEYVVREENKYYNIMAVTKGIAEPTDESIYIGKNLALNSADTVQSYLDYKIRVCSDIIQGHQRSMHPDREAIDKYTHELSVYTSFRKEQGK